MSVVLVAGVVLGSFATASTFSRSTDVQLSAGTSSGYVTPPSGARSRFPTLKRPAAASRTAARTTRPVKTTPAAGTRTVAVPVTVTATERLPPPPPNQPAPVTVTVTGQPVVNDPPAPADPQPALPQPVDARPAQSVFVTFANVGCLPADMVWAEGGVNYGPLYPGQTVLVYTDAGDRWMFVVNGVTVTMYTVSADQPHVDITSGGCP